MSKLGDYIESKADGAVIDAGNAANNLVDAIHAAIKSFFENLVAFIRGLFTPAE